MIIVSIFFKGENRMSQENYVQNLFKKHAQLETQLNDEHAQINPQYSLLKTLKLQKLKIKDKLKSLMASV